MVHIRGDFLIVRVNVDFSKGLTDEQIEMLKEMEASPAVPDEDCPELTHEQIAKFADVASKRRQSRIDGKLPE